MITFWDVLMVRDKDEIVDAFYCSSESSLMRHHVPNLLHPVAWIWEDWREKIIFGRDRFECERAYLELLKKILDKDFLIDFYLREEGVLPSRLKLMLKGCFSYLPSSKFDGTKESVCNKCANERHDLLCQSILRASTNEIKAVYNFSLN